MSPTDALQDQHTRSRGAPASCVLTESAVLCDPGNPRALSHLSRVVIRKHLSCCDLASMHLPSRLKDYLLFKEGTREEEKKKKKSDAC